MTDGWARNINPGERGGHGDLRDGEQYLNRAVRSQIKSVSPTDGKMTVWTNEVYAAQQLTVPPLWFSAKGRETAWGRYMPMGGKKTTDSNGKEIIMGGELCHVIYRNDGTPVFAGYDATATPDGTAGWTSLEKARAANAPGFATFKPLKRGEFDFKSSGNAYIFGSNTGTLLLAGGQAFIKLDNQAYRLESKAAEFHQTSGASQTRTGLVFRKLTPADMAETQIPGGFSEFLIDLNDANPATGLPLNPLQSKVKIHFGDLYDYLAMPVLPLKVPGILRGLISLGDSASATEAFRVEIDQTGNIAWTQGPLGALGLDMTMAKWNALVTTQVTFSALASMGITTPLLTLDGDFVTVAKGADSPMVRGTDLITWIVSTLMIAFNTHVHPTGVGPSGPSVVPLTAPPAAVLSTQVLVK